MLISILAQAKDGDNDIITGDMSLPQITEIVKSLKDQELFIYVDGIPVKIGTITNAQRIVDRFIPADEPYSYKPPT